MNRQLKTSTRRLAAGAAGLAVLAGASIAATQDAAATQTPIVTNLRTGGHGGFDRSVIDLSANWPQLTYTWVTKAQNCASGDTLYVPGKKFLQITLHGAQAHNDQGRNTYVGPGRKASAFFGLKNLKGVRMTCDFEGQVGWVLGVDHTAKVSVGKLTGPHRIYVDIEH